MNPLHSCEYIGDVAPGACAVAQSEARAARRASIVELVAMHTRVSTIKDAKRVRALICAAIGAGSRRGLALKGLNRQLRRRLHDLRDNEVGHIDATCVRILLRHSRQGPVLITVLVGTNNAVQVGALSFHEESISKRRSREALLVKNVDIRTVNAVALRWRSGGAPVALPGAF